jgi:hypothetical protein
MTSVSASANPVRPGLIPFWMLNDASTVEQKINYLRRCHAGGIRALAMHARSGNLIPYASDEWFRMIRELVAEGGRLGMQMWLYDEDPYPSGAAGGLVMATYPELRAEYMAVHEAPAKLKRGQLWLIGGSRVVWAGLVPVGGSGEAQDLTGEVGVLRVDWFMGRWDSRNYYEGMKPFPCPRGDAVRQRYSLRVPTIPAGYRLQAITAEIAGVEGSWGALPDLLNPRAFDVFRTLILDRYVETVGEYFGKTIPGIFTDEAKPHGSLPITRDLWADFQSTRNYDLRTEVYRLFGDVRNDRDIQVRLDYRRWILSRFLKAFVQPYRNFCDAHQLCLVGHFSPEDDPIQETACLGSAMAIMKNMTCPGTDLIVPLTGTEAAPTLNLGSLRVGSVKAQIGAPCGMSESLGLSGWSMTSTQARQILTWQKALGIDRFFLHGFYTSNEGVQNYEAQPDFGPYSSIFQGVGAMNEWLQQLEALLDQDRTCPEVAVINSVTTFWQWAPKMNMDRLVQCRDSLWQTLLGCLQAHLGIHLVDESDLAGAEYGPGGIRVGACVYRKLLVPDIDLMGQEALSVLRKAPGQGVEVHVFGEGPGKEVGSDGSLRVVAEPLGRRTGLPFADRHWVRHNLKPVSEVEGGDAHFCYLRRFAGPDHRPHLLAVNVGDQPLELIVKGDSPSGLRWTPVEADGDFTETGADGLWHVPARGCGLFVAAATAIQTHGRISQMQEFRDLSSVDRQFKLESPNLCRLSTVQILRRGRKVQTVDFPRPYWQIFDDFKLVSGYESYLGTLPLESSVPDSDLCYRFVFDLGSRLKKPVTLCFDPRCARGDFDVISNGLTVQANCAFPLDGILARRMVLRNLKAGRNVLDIRFRIANAMEGLLSQLFLEGDFEVDVRRRTPVLSVPRNRIAAGGWQESGLPHYMGAGVYRWTERIAPDEIQTWRLLELDGICDSAVLKVNGVSVGVRAWAPWRWVLPDLKPGRNRFELRVQGTAGNKHELDWPEQPQGWLGGGRLIKNG